MEDLLKNDFSMKELFIETMDSIIFQNNQATEDIFSHHILPYFLYKDIQCSSKINQIVEEYSYNTYINNIHQDINKNFGSLHKNIVGCSQKKFFELLHPSLLQSYTYTKYEALPEEYLSNFINLKHLKLNVRIFDEKSLENLTHLEELNVEGCKKFTLKSANIFKNLKSLYLGSHLEHIDSELFESLTHLKALIIERCGCILKEDIEKMVQLEFLSINDMTDVYTAKNIITDRIIEKLVNLKSLELYNEDIITGSCLITLKKLEHLRISDQHIQVEYLKNLATLKYLHIEHVGLIGGKFLENLINLKTLILKDVKLSSEEDFGRLTKLEYLSIINIGENITDNHIKELINLKYLKIEQNRGLVGDGYESLIHLNEISTCDSRFHFNNLLKIYKNNPQVIINLA